MLQGVGSMEDVLGLFVIHHVNVTQDGQVKIALMKRCQQRLNPNLMSSTHLVLSRIDSRPKFSYDLEHERSKENFSAFQINTIENMES